MNEPRRVRVAIAGWEIGRVGTGFGAKVGGLGAVLEELPSELVRAGVLRGETVEITLLSPCFGHYDRSALRPVGTFPARIGDGEIPFEAYERVFEEPFDLPDGSVGTASVRCVYFWDDWKLNWTSGRAIYPTDARFALDLYGAVAQAMAGYVRATGFDSLHLHDYHVALIPFYLDEVTLENLGVHLTIHNATYQGITPLIGGGYATLSHVGLDGPTLFHHYFDFFDNVNPLRAAVLKVHELGGRVTTVSGDLEGRSGYASELAEPHSRILARARRIARGAEPEVFVPNMHMDLLEKIPIAGITNGLGPNNRPERMPELTPQHIQKLEARRGGPLFRDPIVAEAMRTRDHRFDAGRLHVKDELRRLVFREAFGREPSGRPIVITALGRLVQQKNFDVVERIIPHLLAQTEDIHVVILASATGDDEAGLAQQARLAGLARANPTRVSFDSSFNAPLGKLLQAGSDFALVPSRFEPCGLVDYEACLLGTVPIVRATGGLTKVRHCGYLYEWLDMRDPWGEAEAFASTVLEAARVLRDDPARHLALMLAGMATDTSWEPAARTYLDLYRFGQLCRRWKRGDRSRPEAFLESIGPDRALFERFFDPGWSEFADPYDRQLRLLLRG